MPQLMPTPREVEVRSAVEQIAVFADSARPEHLRSDVRQLFKRNILDSLGCTIAGLHGRPFHALREQFVEYRAPGRCTLIGGGKTSADQAALFNSSLVRYVDLLDSYMAVGGLCHPSDNFGTIPAAAEQVETSGEEFMLALAVAYEIQCRFTAVVPVMAKGFNHATQLAISAAAGAGKLFGLSAGGIANAIAIATVDDVSLACVHAEPVSQWKGFSPGMTGMRAVYAASLAKRGFTGPKGCSKALMIKAGLVHAQFESIHPFLDGNGRVGRLLITFMLCAEEVLREPVLYLSLFFKKHRRLYYDRLNETRESEGWTAWLDFFLQGVRDTANQAARTAGAIDRLFNADKEKIERFGRGAASALLVYRYAQANLLFPIRNAAREMG